MVIKRGTKVFLLPLLYSLSGCDAGSEPAAQAEVPSAVVTVQALVEQPVMLERLYPGRVTAFRTAQIRPQVSGIITDMLFSQGSEIKAGQPLFQIDPAPFRAEVNSAAAALKKAQASYQQLQARAARLAKLRGTGAVSQQDYEDAASVAAQANATIAESRAVLDRRKLDLAYATVKAPISGRVDQNFITEGALVSANDSQPMASLQQIDSVYVDVRQPASDLSYPTPTHADMAVDEPAVGAEILSSAGEPFPNRASILFNGVSVDPGTGDVVTRIKVSNAERTLLPGMYVQAKISRQLAAKGLVIPQEAVIRDGNTTRVWLDDAGKAKSVEVKLGTALNNNWFVRDGLHAGDQLVIQGASKLQEGMSLQTDSAIPQP